MISSILNAGLTSLKAYCKGSTNKEHHQSCILVNTQTVHKKNYVRTTLKFFAATLSLVLWEYVHTYLDGVDNLFIFLLASHPLA